MEIMKIGVSIKPNETTAWIYSENQKSLNNLISVTKDRTLIKLH